MPFQKSPLRCARYRLDRYPSSRWRPRLTLGRCPAALGRRVAGAGSAKAGQGSRPKTRSARRSRRCRKAHSESLACHPGHRPPVRRMADSGAWTGTEDQWSGRRSLRQSLTDHGHSWQHRDRQTDAQKGDEGIEDDREDLQGDAGGRLLRGHGHVRGQAVGRRPSWRLRGIKKAG